MKADRVINHSIIGIEEIKKYLNVDHSRLQQDPAWFRSVIDGLGYTVFGMLSGFDEPLMLFVYFECKKGPFKFVGSPLKGSMTPYQKPILLKNIDVEDQVHILRSQFNFLKKKGYSWIEYGFQDDFVGIERAVKMLKVGHTPKNTMVLDIEDSKEKMWDNMQSRSRNMVRKAVKSGVIVRRCDGTHEEVNKFYEMMISVFKKSLGIPPHPKEYYMACAKELVSTGKMLFLSAEVDGKMIAAGLFPFDKSEIHYMSGASNFEYKKYAANNLIQWEVIQFAVEKGIKKYDLGGVGLSSIDKFKESVGGTPVSYNRFVWRSRSLSLLEQPYLSLRTMLNRWKARMSKQSATS